MNKKIDQPQTMHKPFSCKQVYQNPLILCAVGFGSGLLPKAPGTWGSLLAMILYWILGLNTLSVSGYSLFLLVTFLFGIGCCGQATRAVKVPDHPSIVWDEFVGYWLTLLLAPSAWYWPVIGFVLFRFFDITKPFPIGWVDKKCQGGFGIMIDDVIAGVYAGLVLQALYVVCVYMIRLGFMPLFSNHLN